MVKAQFPSLPRDQYRSELIGCTGYLQDTCTSGTSFAAPHMSGIIARYLQGHPGATRNQIVSDLQYYSSIGTGGIMVVEPGGSQIPVLSAGHAF